VSSQRFHGDPQRCDCSTRTSAICSFLNTVETLLGRRTGLSGLLEKNVYYESSHALVSCLVSPRESKNPVIKIIMFSVVKIKNFIFNSKPLLFDFAVVFWFNLVLVSCCAKYVNETYTTNVILQKH